MPRIESVIDAENVVRSYYPGIGGSQPYSFETHKQGNIWIVVFKIRSNTGFEQNEWHIDSETGRVHLKKR